MLPWQCFYQGAIGQNFQFVFFYGLFLAQKVFISAFLVQIRNQRLKIDPCAKFQPDWTKDKGSSIFDLEQYRKLLDDVILNLIVMTSEKLLPILRGFVPEYHHVMFGCNWTTNKEKTDIVPPSLYFTKIPQPE